MDQKGAADTSWGASGVGLGMRGVDDKEREIIEGGGKGMSIKSNEERTPEERRRNAQKAGKASGKARKQKKLLRECLEAILMSKVPDGELQELLEQSGVENSYDNAMSLALIKKALQGDPKAFEVVRDTIGQKPMDKVEHSGAVAVKQDKLASILEQLKP